MPSHDDDDMHSNSAHYLKPCHADGTEISFNGNDACIAGAVHAFGLWVVRTTTHLDIIEHNCAHDHGKIYIDDPAAISFITGQVDDPHDVHDPCPPTPARVVEVNRLHGLATAAALLARAERN